VLGGVHRVLPVDIHIPGCPPSPTAILQGLLALANGINAPHQMEKP
jgi:NADH:ubiquinone oxidoreductase subunit B-like Fe-S oxidoreductase